MAGEAGIPMSSTWSGRGPPHPPVRGLVVPGPQRRVGTQHRAQCLLLTRRGTASGGREGDEVQLHTDQEEMRQEEQKGTGVRVPPGVGVHTSDSLSGLAGAGALEKGKPLPCSPTSSQGTYYLAGTRGQELKGDGQAGGHWNSERWGRGQVAAGEGREAVGAGERAVSPACCPGFWV